MKKLSSYEVSSIVDEIEQTVRNKYDLEDNWYGDCYPQEILDLEISMRTCADEEELDFLKEQVVDLFDCWGRQEFFSK